MATKKKLLQAAAGQAGGAGLDVDEVFSNYLYTGNGSTQTITNGIDLDGEGGLVWIKSRTGTTDHWLSDSERAYTTRFLRTNLTNAEANNNASVTSYSADGFSVGSASAVNTNNQDYASWTFRKAEKFFTCLTYTGDGTVGRDISHNLGSKPGCVIVKKTSGSEGWFVSHRGYNSGLNTGYLNMTNAFIAGTSTEIPVYYATDTTFRVSNISGQSYANTNGATYVAYLFAHNDGDGDFGPDADQDIIKCGSYTGDGGAGTTEVNLGFEPQWILVKASSAADNWFIIDNMRGWATHNNTANDAYLLPNAANAESTGGFLDITSTGFKTTLYSNVNVSGREYIYTAIRRGPLAPPESATDVFAIDTQGSTGDGNEPSYRTTFPVDMVIQKATDGGNGIAADRLRGTKRLFLNDTSAETSYSSGFFDYMNGWRSTTSTYAPSHAYMWKRAPNYMDVVAFDGGGAGDVVNHNLGVKPDLMMYKRRSATNDWIVYNSIDGANYAMFLNKTDARESQIQWWNNTEPTATNFTTGSKAFSGSTYIAYLFASLAGISKVGSVTHSGTTNVDCGFSSGARFVLLKRTDATGDWYVWDSERGIVSGNDPYLLLNSTAAEVTNTDYIDPLSSGFTITSSFTAGDYIFYAIA